MVHYFDPPLQIFKKGILTLEYSVILALSLRTCKLNMTDNSGPWLTFLIDLGGGVNVLWYNILTPPPPNIKERYFDNGIQCQLSFITQNM